MKDLHEFKLRIIVGLFLFAILLKIRIILFSLLEAVIFDALEFLLVLFLISLEGKLIS